MRVTAFMLFKQFTRNLNKNLTGLSKYQEQLSTGRKLTKPSDDVIASRGVMSYKVSINNAEQYQRNAEEGKTTLGYTESLLSSTRNILNRARELAVASSNDVSTTKEREMTSFEVQNLYNEVLDIGNSKLRNKYVFSGYMTSTEAFSSTGVTGVYQGDTNDINVYVSDGITTKINTTGNEAFSDDTKYITADLTGQTLTGGLRITVGTTGTPVFLENQSAAHDSFTAASPEEIRDTINASMTAAIQDTDTIGTGTLTFQAGTRDPITLSITAANNTPEGIRDALNNLTDPNIANPDPDYPFVTAGIFEDATNQQRLFFRPTTPGETFSINVADDDGNDTDSSGLSILLKTDELTNLTENALGIEAFVMNGVQGKRLLIAPTTPNTGFTIETDEDDDGTFNETTVVDNDTDTTGLSLLSQRASTWDAATSNLSNSVSFFTVMDNLRDALANNDAAGIRGSIYLLDGSLDALLNTTADVGSKLKYMDDQQDMLEENKLSYERARSTLEDADIAKVALEVTKVQSALEALRISSMKSLTQSLIQFLN